MNRVEGDLIDLSLQGKFDVIVHGCNCFCTMGAGVALLIQQEFPEAYAADLVTIKGDRNKLGTYSQATVMRKGHEITILNGYTQFHYQGESVLADYEAIRLLFKMVKKNFAGKRIAYPKIGSGLGKGNWDQIEEIINTELQGENHSVVHYKS
jgi:O-acetyl-ADP-ribose deacetylase (regulator of RNase III)